MYLHWIFFAAVVLCFELTGTAVLPDSGIKEKFLNPLGKISKEKTERKDPLMKQDSREGLEDSKTKSQEDLRWFFYPRHSSQEFRNYFNKYKNLQEYLRRWHHIQPFNSWRSRFFTPRLTISKTSTARPTTTRTPLPSFDEWLDGWEEEQDQLECGLPEIEPRLIDLRIVGGTTAIRGSWPWMVSMKLAGQHWCGGVLISKQWVVSSAHCMLFMPGVDNPQLWEIRLGRFNPGFNITESESEQRFNISGEPIFYENINIKQIYSGQPVDNDLVLLKLEKPAEITKYVKPICLPKKSEESESGTRCVITGYGQVAPNVGSSVKLKQAIVPIVDHEKCHKIQGYEEFLTSRMVCAGYEYGGVDTCKMDSGGPLQCFSSDRWILTGLTSWGDGGGESCAEPLKPGVYTRITSYVDWIQTMLYEDYVNSLQ